MNTASIPVALRWSPSSNEVALIHFRPTSMCDIGPFLAVETWAWRTSALQMIFGSVTKSSMVKLPLIRDLVSAALFFFYRCEVLPHPKVGDPKWRYKNNR